MSQVTVSLLYRHDSPGPGFCRGRRAAQVTQGVLTAASLASRALPAPAPEKAEYVLLRLARGGRDVWYSGDPLSHCRICSRWGSIGTQGRTVGICFQQLPCGLLSWRGICLPLASVAVSALCGSCCVGVCEFRTLLRGYLAAGRGLTVSAAGWAAAGEAVPLRARAPSLCLPPLTVGVDGAFLTLTAHCFSDLA